MLMVAEKDIQARYLALAEQEWGPAAPSRMDAYFREMAEGAEDGPITLEGDCVVVATEPQQEAAAAAGLIGRRIPAYCPQEPKSIRSNYHKRRVVLRPMIVGYMFAGYDGTDKAWHRIHGVRGVRRILSINDKPVTVPVAALSFIRTKEAEAMANFGTRKRIPMPCKLGDWVQIVEHPSFTGLFGRVAQLLAERERIVLHVDLFGRQTPVEVSANQVRVV
jgi:transcription termination/antitermination protein NusG